jgi:hypothetical protein
MATEFEIRGEWRTEDFGHVYTVKAMTAAGRVLAAVNIEVPLDVLVDIRERFGEEWVRHVEQTAQEQVAQVANGWDRPRKSA